MADTRNRGNSYEKGDIDSQAKDALEKIFKSRDMLMDTQVLAQLKKTLPDAKLIDTVFDYYKKRLGIIKHKSSKFKDALLRKYTNLSTEETIMKAKKYAKKYDLTNGEMSMFINMLFTDNSPNIRNSMFNVPTSPLSKTLGYSVDAVMGDKLNIGEGDIQHLEKILQIDKVTKQLHQQLILQTLTYLDCRPESLTGQFDKSKNNPYSHVHPIIAALFLPKVSYLEEQMIIASISNIVKNKSEGKPIMTANEYQLYWDMITDPNQSACASSEVKPMEDLKNRVILQTKLWEAVMNIRNGRYYYDAASDGFNGFMTALASCSNSIFDAPDLSYTHDEGTVLRRIMNAFSLRPTVVSISSLNIPNVVASMSINPTMYTQVTTVPIINMRLPRPIGGLNVNISSVNLTDALSQPQWYVEGKTLVPKTQNIMMSRDVIFFYVDRRCKAFNYATINKPFMIAGLPSTISGLDTINDIPVISEPSMMIGNDTFDLRSIVIAETTDLKNKGGKVITGCSTMIVSTNDETRVSEYYWYNPLAAGFKHMSNGALVDVDPVLTLPYDAPFGTGPSFKNMSERLGTIFMYAKRV